MADVKVSALPSDSSLDGNHYVPINDPTGPTTKRTLLSTLAAFFFNQLNIPDGSGSPRTRMTEWGYDFVASGLVWSGDAYASTRNASMTSGTVYINGRRILISSVTARSFTASRDTYIDILDNADGTGTLVYTEVTNNNASPALASNSIRIGIIVTGASNIANVGSVNQGQSDKILPIASSIPYQVTDSLGNRICSRAASGSLLSIRRQIANFGSVSATHAQVTALSAIIKANAGDKLKVSFHAGSWQAGGLTTGSAKIWDGAVIAGTQLDQSDHTQTASTYFGHIRCEAIVDIATTGTKTFNISWASSTASGATLQASATQPMYIMVERLQ